MKILSLGILKSITYDDNEVHHLHLDIQIDRYIEDFYQYMNEDNHVDIEKINHHHKVLKLLHNFKFIVFFKLPLANATTCTDVIFFISCIFIFRLNVKLIELQGISVFLLLV